MAPEGERTAAPCASCLTGTKKVAAEHRTRVSAEVRALRGVVCRLALAIERHSIDVAEHDVPRQVDIELWSTWEQTYWKPAPDADPSPVLASVRSRQWRTIHRPPATVPPDTAIRPASRHLPTCQTDA